jgi:hypothetical protein
LCFFDVTSPLVNDLTTGGTDKYLSAEQGKVAKGLIDTNTSDISTLKDQINQTSLTNIEIGSSPITSLTGMLDGFVDSLVFKGKTMYKLSGGTYTDTYSSGVTLESCGQAEGKVVMSSLKANNTVGDSLSIALSTPLRGLTINTTKYQDILNVANKSIVRNVGKKIFTGASTEVWSKGNPTLQTNTLQFICSIGDCKTGLSSTEINLMNDKFAMISSTNNIANDSESIAIDENGQLLVRILKSKLATQDVAGFKLWLNSVNITIIYPLANAITETIKKVGTLKTFAGGYLQLDNAIVPTVNFNYPVKLASVVEEHTQIIDDLSDTVAENANKIGDLSTLTTTDKSSLVNAIKENTQNISNLSSKANVTMASNWVNVSGYNSTISKTGKMVSVNCFIQGGSYNASAILCVVPDGYKPSSRTLLRGVTYENVERNCFIENNGNIWIDAGLTSAPTWFAVTGTFQLD